MFHSDGEVLHEGAVGRARDRTFKHCDRLDQRDFVSDVVGKYLLHLKVDDD